MPGCKAPEILNREAYWDVRRTMKDEGNEADGRFSTARHSSVSTSIAKSGHRSSHSLHATQSPARTTTTLSESSSSNTFFGQKCTQIPHPLHHSRCITCRFNRCFAISYPYPSELTPNLIEEGAVRGKKEEAQKPPPL